MRIIFIPGIKTPKWYLHSWKKDLQKNFVVLVHDANTPVSYKYKTPGIPAIWFLKENGEPFIRPLVGFIPKKNLTVVMKNAKLEFKK